MDLKVWVEGMPRVVCGIHEQTTCRDVVRVLAQTLGRPGRYSLVERWRDSQRTIAPAVPLLADLRQRGEYASDVELVLCQTDPHLLHYDSMTSLNSDVSRDSIKAKSGGGGGGGGPRLLNGGVQLQNQQPYPNQQQHMQMSYNNGHHSGNSSSDGGRTAGMRDREAAVAMRAVADRRVYNGVGTAVNGGNTRTLTADAQLQTQYAAYTRDAPPTYGSLPRQIYSNNNNNNNRANFRDTAVYGVDSSTLPSGFVRLNNGQVVMSDGSGGGDNAQRDDVMQQLTHQADAIQRNAAAMLALDKDIADAEETLRRAERELAFDEGTARRLEECVEPELEELELVSWADKLKLEEEQQARTELHLADTRSLIARLNTELTWARDELQRCEQQINSERDALGNSDGHNGGDGEVGEMAAQARLRLLGDALTAARAEHEAGKRVLEELNKELKVVDLALTQSTDYLHTLHSQTADVNQQGVAAATAATDQLSEDSECPPRLSSSRSTTSPLRRVIDKPSELQDLAPSAAHPQGMWV